MATFEQSAKFTTNDFKGRVTIYRAKISTEEDGTRRTAWEKGPRVWANVNTISTATTNENGTETGRRLNFRIVMRKGVQLSLYDRIEYRGTMLRLAAPPAELENRVVLADCYLLKEEGDGYGDD